MTAHQPATLTQNDVKILEKKTAYQGHFRIDRYQIRHRLFAGGWSRPLNREIFERGHAAAALLYDPQRSKLVMIEQFRIGALHQYSSPWLLEIVAGIIQTGEQPEEVVHREAQEEAGVVIHDLLPICNYLVSPGGSSEKVSLFCGRVDAITANGIHGLEEEGEDICVHLLDTAEVYGALAQGQIVNAATIIALQWLQLNEQKVKELWLK